MSSKKLDSHSRNVRTSLPEGALVIDEIKIGNGRPVRGGRLFGCYFVKEQDSDDYDFFDREGQLLNSAVKAGLQFEFTFPDNAEIKPDGWQMTFHKDKGKDVAHGDWMFLGDNDNDNDNDDDEEDGTFHAQAGGGADNYKVSTATAY